MIFGAKNQKIVIIRHIKQLLVVEGSILLQEGGELSVKAQTNQRLALKKKKKRQARENQSRSIRV